MSRGREQAGKRGFRLRTDREHEQRAEVKEAMQKSASSEWTPLSRLKGNFAALEARMFVLEELISDPKPVDTRPARADVTARIFGIAAFLIAAGCAAFLVAMRMGMLPR